MNQTQVKILSSDKEFINALATSLCLDELSCNEVDPVVFLIESIKEAYTGVLSSRHDAAKEYKIKEIRNL